jgi:hypothetical protein
LNVGTDNERVVGDRLRNLGGVVLDATIAVVPFAVE